MHPREEILEEVVRNLRFDDQLDVIMKSSICIPCDLPYVNNIWLKRSRGDRPPVVPEGSTNLGFIGQYVELEQGHRFHLRIFHSLGVGGDSPSCWKHDSPPPVYQGQVGSEGNLGRPGGVCLSVIRATADANRSEV